MSSTAIVRQQIIDRHHKAYPTNSDEVWGTNAICAECDRSWPCDVAVVAGTENGRTEQGS